MAEGTGTAGHTSVATQEMDVTESAQSNNQSANQPMRGRLNLNDKRVRNVVFALMLIVFYACDVNYMREVNESVSDSSDSLDEIRTVITGDSLVLFGCGLSFFLTFILENSIMERVASAALVLGSCISIAGYLSVSFVEGILLKTYPTVIAILFAVDIFKHLFDDSRTRLMTYMVSSMGVCGVVSVIWMLEFHEIVECEDVEYYFYTDECEDGHEYGLMAFGHLLFFVAAAGSFFCASSSVPVTVLKILVILAMGFGTLLVIIGCIMYCEEQYIPDEAVSLFVGYGIFFFMIGTALKYDAAAIIAASA